jgi:hypothetical protein
MIDIPGGSSMEVTIVRNEAKAKHPITTDLRITDRYRPIRLLP